MNNESTQQRFWTKASQSVCRRINTGFCLQTFLPLLLGISVIQGCLLLLLRKSDLSQTPLWIGFAIAVLLSLAGSIGWNRRRFFSLTDGFVHLESRLSLHNALTAAHLGHTAWPPPQRLPQALRWSWQRLTLPPAVATGFILLAGWIPLQQQAAAEFHPPEEPLAWQEIESWTEILKERDLFEEETLAQWKEQVQSLRDQPEQDWYSHSSLEAGDNLRDSAADSIQRLQNALEKAAYPLSLARESLEDMPSGLQALLQEHWLDALSELNNGTLSLSKEALAQLGDVDFANLQSLSREQIERLEQMLRDGSNACSASLGECEGGGDRDGAPCPECGGFCGSWGIGRGPGPANLTFREFPTLIDSQRREAVSNPDLSRAALGQQLGVTQAEPEVDADAQGRITAAGNAVLTGDGGEAVFHSRLTPAERRRLKEYFR